MLVEIRIKQLFPMFPVTDVLQQKIQFFLECRDKDVTPFLSLSHSSGTHTSFGHCSPEAGSCNTVIISAVLSRELGGKTVRGRLQS